IAARLSVDWAQCDSDRRADGASAAFNGIWLRQAGNDFVAEFTENVAVSAIAHDHLEFITAEPKDSFFVADNPEESLPDLLEKGVAGRMTQGVVDLFEAIEIQHQHGARPLGDARSSEIGFQYVCHPQPVRQAR